MRLQTLHPARRTKPAVMRVLCFLGVRLEDEVEHAETLNRTAKRTYGADRRAGGSAQRATRRGGLSKKRLAGVSSRTAKGSPASPGPTILGSLFPGGGSTRPGANPPPQ